MLPIISLFVLICFTLSFAHASTVRPKKRKASALLQDKGNNSDDVQPVESDTMMQTTFQQQQPVTQEGNIISESFRVMLNGGRFFHTFSLLHIFTQMVSIGRYSLFTNVIFGNHIISFHFYRAHDMLSLRLNLPNITKGQITIQFKIFMNTTEGSIQEIAHSNPTSAPLTNGMDMPLCKFCDIQSLIQRNAFANLDIGMLVDSAHQDMFIPCPSYDEGRYKEIVEFGVNMSNKEFLKQLCPLVKTLEQYKGIVSHLKSRKLVASFYVHGDGRVIKEVIVESRIYDNRNYVWRGDLEIALPLALKEDNHDRVVELLKIRKGITVEKDKQLEQEGLETGFGIFVYWFLYDLVPWNDGMALKRFLTLRVDELGDENPDILSTLCQELVSNLKSQLHLPNAEKLLTDLIGQPFLLTPATFVKGFLEYNNDKRRSDLIKYAWSEVIEEGLKKECEYGGKKLWRVMKKERPDQFPGEFPSTADAFSAVLVHFPTKQKLEMEWNKKNAKILYDKLKSLGFIFGVIPNVLWSIISSYAVSLTDTDGPTVSAK